MKSTNRKRVILVSSAVILLCMTIIVGTTAALFSDSTAIRNHLQAGDLEVSLKRTYLEYSTLNSVGELAVTSNSQTLYLNGSVNENVFGVDSETMRIVPGSYFDAHLEISNDGNVAFNYSVSIQLVGNSNALAEQLKVIVTHSDGSETEAMLSEMIAGRTIQAGNIKAGGANQQFSVRVEFIDDIDYNQGLDVNDERMNNNLAQTQIAEFDLVVSAVQATTATTTP